MSEFDFIDSIRRRVTDRPPVLTGIGDDAAVLAASSRPLLVTTDMLMEGTDFIFESLVRRGSPDPAILSSESSFGAGFPTLFPSATPELAGRKSLAVNLSDIAAMGGVPTVAFVSVALPKDRGEPFAQAFFDGLLSLADEFGVIIAGGDTNTWNGPLVANLTVQGHPAGTKAVLRSGAKPGDAIFVTGELGGSLAGHHLTFTPRVAEAKQLTQRVDLHAMIDISDGLAADLHHILDASGVGAVLESEHIPISAAAQSINDGRSPLEHALSDGEDFELLFTVSPADAATLQQSWPGLTRLTRIGEITTGSGCVIRDQSGGQHPLSALGWRHGWQ